VTTAAGLRVVRVVDLSAPIDESTVVYPGDPTPHFAVHSTIERNGFNLLSVQMGSQSGTHVDAPYHFEDDGARIDELPLERFAGRAVVVDATTLGAREPITWELVAPVSSRLDGHAVVLLHTGWSRHYGSPAYFDHPYLDAEACRRILDAGVRTICIDAINIDETPDDTHPGVGFPVHHLIAAVDGVIGENFRNLGEVTSPDMLVMAFPLAFQGADGAPVRAVALELATG
jgi:kynurenine formamidase